MKNGEEMNENGNVGSFLQLVEIHFGLTPDMMRLLRIGSNVSSFITLKPADRKNYISRLMSEIEVYLKFYRFVNDKLRLLKVMMTTNANNLNKCRVEDPLEDMKAITELGSILKNEEVRRRKIDIELDRLRGIVANNNIHDLLSKRSQAELNLKELDKVKDLIQSEGLEGKSLKDLEVIKKSIEDSKISTQSEINALLMQIDTLMTNNASLEAKMRNSSVIHNVSAIQSLISETEKIVNGTDKTIKGFVPRCSSEELGMLIVKLHSFNEIGNIMYTFSKLSLEKYLTLIRDDKDVRKFITAQVKLNLNRVSETDLRKLLDQLFEDDMIIMPNCDTPQYSVCPYYRMSRVIQEHRDQNETEILEEETINQMRIIVNNMDTIFNGLYELRSVDIPEGLADILTMDHVYSRLRQRLLLFDTTDLRNYLSLSKSHEIYMEQVERLKQYNREMMLIRQSGSLDLSDMMESNIRKITEHRGKINELKTVLDDISRQLERANRNIVAFQKHQDGQKYRKILEGNIRDLNDIIQPLEKATEEERELRYQQQMTQSSIDHTQKQINEIQSRVNEYNRLTEEADKLAEKHRKHSLVLDALSTKRGVPMEVIERYLRKIRKFANELLEIIYDKEVFLKKFEIDPESFAVPFSRDGHTIADIRYGSQSEVSLMTMALSFALAYNVSDRYNIILLDEVDNGLDETSRLGFMKMLYRQMKELHSEQIIVISHNMAQMTNIPMDVILLSDMPVNEKLHNVIYQS
jgi:DNA repair exonuclease SbcCD ATPase subunit